MKTNSIFFLTIISILFILGYSSCQEKPVLPDSSEYAAGEIIVKFKPEAFNEGGDLISESINNLNAKYGLVSMEQLFKGNSSAELSYIYILKFPDNIDINIAIEEYKKDPSVIYAEPNYVVRAINQGPNADRENNTLR